LKRALPKNVTHGPYEMEPTEAIEKLLRYVKERLEFFPTRAWAAKEAEVDRCAITIFWGHGAKVVWYVGWAGMVP
jgi:hypothetical protein